MKARSAIKFEQVHGHVLDHVLEHVLGMFMSILRLSLLIPSFSINKATCGRNRAYSPEARKFRAQFFLELDKYRQEILAFNKTRYRSYHVEYTFYMPDLYTKGGKVSHNSGDLTNLEKLPQDFLFNKKYHGTAWLRKMNFIERKLYPLNSLVNLNTDDCFITRLVSEKVSGPEYRMDIVVRGI